MDEYVEEKAEEPVRENVGSQTSLDYPSFVDSTYTVIFPTTVREGGFSLSLSLSYSEWHEQWTESHDRNRRVSPANKHPARPEQEAISKA